MSLDLRRVVDRLKNSFLWSGFSPLCVFLGGEVGALLKRFGSIREIRMKSQGSSTESVVVSRDPHKLPKTQS